MMWTVRHLWPPGARFLFYCDRHWSLIVLQNMNGTTIFLHTKEGVTQGYPLEMIAYGIVIIPLIKNIKQEIHDVTQTWYADDTGALGTFAIIDTYFDSLTHQGPRRRYYPKPSKSVLIVRPENLEARKEFGARYVFQVCMGARYLGGYIGEDKSKIDWMRERTLTWEENIKMIRKTAGKYHQENYAAVVRTIQ